MCITFGQSSHSRQVRCGALRTLFLESGRSLFPEETMVRGDDIPLTTPSRDGDGSIVPTQIMIRLIAYMRGQMVELHGERYKSS